MRWLVTTLIFLTPVLCAASGADDPAVPIDPELAKYDARIKPNDRLHWSYQPIKKPAVPKVKDRAWVVNPIDAFVLHGLEEQGWQPAPSAPPRVLIRRLYFDLVGLPPTPDAVEEFVAAWEGASAKRQATGPLLGQWVDRLLASPHHGERWGRHWLDVVRYAETNGYERDAAKPNIWRYRDYVIRAFNQDKPFDQFILEQLAGDELDDLPSLSGGRGAGGEGVTADSLIALGFNRLGPWDDEPADPKEDRFDQLDDIVSATSLAFLGLTMGCCRCHDHKFDALTMHDYYRMVAIFNPLQRPQAGRTELDLPVGTKAELDKLAEWSRKMAEVIKKAPDGKFLPRDIAEQVAALKQAEPKLPRGYFMHERGTIPDTHLLIRGKATRPGPKVDPGFPTVLVEKQPPFPPPSATSSRRRLTLAKWIASPQNPLTARVIVNRIWQGHFGEGLVRTPNDFGIMGQAPSHPELLDWLAATFMENGWSIKKLHRLIMTSSTYQMSKRSNAAYAAKDPENQYLWRFPVKRLEVEAIRDAMLSVSGRLNPAMYGPSVYPEVPKEALAGNSDPDKIWKPFVETEASRRTVYAHIKRSFVVPLLETLDLCDTTRPSDKRQVTTVAPQALMLFNGAFVNRQAKYFADRLRREAGDDPARQIERAYLLALGRRPSGMEQTMMTEFLRRESLEQLCRVVFNLNEMMYVD